MSKYINAAGILATLLVVVLLAACSQSTTTTSSSQTSSTTSSQATTTTSSSSGPTAGELTASGQTVFATYCTACHGDNGQGVTAPAIIGSNAHLAKYNTAQGLLDFVDTVMPANAPGSLSAQQYLEVVTYLLVQNNDVTSDTVINTNQLGAITLK
jgi:mono/diheme cytochrome c family protein